MTPDQKLDEALKETFPASDPFYLPPVVVAVPQPLNPAPRRGTERDRIGKYATVNAANAAHQNSAEGSVAPT